MHFKLINDSVVAKIDDDGLSRMSCSIEHPEYLAWLSEGNTPEPADQPSPRDLILQQIIALEATQARCLREATLTGDKTRLQALDDQIAALRAQL